MAAVDGMCGVCNTIHVWCIQSAGVRFSDALGTEDMVMGTFVFQLSVCMLHVEPWHQTSCMLL